MTQPEGDHFINLLNRTIANHDYIASMVAAQKHINGDGMEIVFDVTQAINSFLSSLLFPWEVVLNESSLRNLSPNARSYSDLGFPTLQSSLPESDECLANMGQILEKLRHGIAHGGIRLLSFEDMRLECPDRTDPCVAPGHIAAIEIESRSNHGNGPRNWGCIITVTETVMFLHAMQKMTNKRKYVRQEVWERHVRMFVQDH